ncbi:MAG: toxin-antitoxin system HicB family antitoxin [Verrucomicrobiae bacterium]|nr:toxin-antitoxin system HicB family antitoxin [Verrucomicrobiae bacterium]
MSKITIEIPEYLRQQVESLSSAEGFSIDQFFATAASEKLSVIRELDYVRERASRANDEEFEAVLEHIPFSPVSEDWDRMPIGTIGKSDASN